MDSKPEANVGKFLSRHLSQLKILARLMEHEMDAAKGGREVVVDRAMMESMVDTLEIFIDDCEGASGGGRPDRKSTIAGESKPTVARLN